MSDDTTISDTDTSPVSASLGQRMRLTRESAGVSLEEMSSHLRLTEHRIQALEDSRYELLPEPAFVKGYIRGYARVVDADPEPWVREYAQSSRTESELKQTVLPEKDNQSRAGGLSAMLAVAVLLGAGAWYFWQQNHAAEARPDAAEQSVITAPSATASPSAVEPAAEIEGGLSEAEPSSVVEPLASLTADSEPRSDEPTASAPPAPVAPIVAPTEPVKPAEPVAEPITGTDKVPVSNTDPALAASESELEVDTLDATDEVLTVAAAALPAPALEKDVIELSTDFKSWVEIRDAEDNRLMFGMLRANRARRLTGKAPFNVFLGNAPAVQMTINGTPVERPRFNAEKNTARFSLAADGEITD